MLSDLTMSFWSICWWTIMVRTWTSWISSNRLHFISPTIRHWSIWEYNQELRLKKSSSLQLMKGLIITICMTSSENRTQT